MGCPSPTTDYKFEFISGNSIGGTESTTGTDCPPYSTALEGQAHLEAERRFKAYLEAKSTDPCGPNCRVHTRTPWVKVPGLADQFKLKRIFFSIICTDKEGVERTCLYSFEMMFNYRVLQSTVTCIPDLDGPNDFFMPPIQLEGDC